MISILVPKMMIQLFSELSTKTLLTRGIRCLICDVDNTLIPHHSQCFSKDVLTFIDLIQKEGIEVILISNNVKSRIESLAKPLGVKCYGFAKKPLRITYQRILNDSGYKPNEVACLGDQLFTDIVGANRMKMLSIYTYPLDQNDIVFTKVNRKIEKFILRKIEKRKCNE